MQRNYHFPYQQTTRITIQNYFTWSIMQTTLLPLAFSITHLPVTTPTISAPLIRLNRDDGLLSRNDGLRCGIDVVQQSRRAGEIADVLRA